MLRFSIVVLAAAAASFSPRLVYAWADIGHSAISVMAFEMLPEQQRQKLVALIESHPYFDRDLAAPPELNEAERRRWLLGKMSFWPDTIRGSDEDRPTWHYELGANETFGDTSAIPIPQMQGDLPGGSDLSTQDLHVVQAIQLCHQILIDESQPKPKRAIALAWLIHLVGDLHQPMHAGSLYAPGLFAEADGDRGGNRIPVADRNLHGYWDFVLGGLYDRLEVDRLVQLLKGDESLMTAGKAVAAETDPRVYQAESRSAAKQYVYVAEVQQAVRAAIESGATRLQPLTLSTEYAEQATELSRLRAVQAAHRLATMLGEVP